MRHFLLCSLVLVVVCLHAAEERAEDVATVREAGKQLIARLAEEKAAEEAGQTAQKAWAKAADEAMKKGAKPYDATVNTEEAAASRAACDFSAKARGASLAAKEAFKVAARKAPKEAARILEESHLERSLQFGADDAGICDALLAAAKAKEAARRAAAQKAYDERPQAVKDAEKAKKEELMAAVMGVWKFAPMKDNGRIIEPAGEVTISADAYKVTTPNGTETTPLRDGNATSGEVQFVTGREDKFGRPLLLHLRPSKDQKMLIVQWYFATPGSSGYPDSILTRK